MKTKTLTITATTFILILTLLLAGCTVGPVSIEEVMISKNLTEDYIPVEYTSIFPSGTTAIYLSIKVNNFTPDDKLVVMWNYLEASETISTNELIVEEKCSGYHHIEIRMAEGFPSGRYNAEIYLNDELIETVGFSVE